jgi:mRNA-degrading endonuclease RelE of RelBE toxin-antitoxin system
LARRKRYRIEYTDEAVQQLRGLTAHRRAIVLDSVEAQLAHEPTIPTRNRKLMRANTVAPWELRIGALRVYFDVVEVPRAVVTVRAVGIKVRERVRIGGVEVDIG